MMYNKIVQDCFFQPGHVGVLDLTTPFSAYFRSDSIKSGLIIDLYMQCTKDKVITKVCFKTNGNPYVIAALEWISRQVEGRDLDNLPLLNYQQLVGKLEIPVNQYPVALHIEDVYKEVLVLMKMKFEGYDHECGDAACE